ncbi:MAG TPA: potassium-transporting ATPase subunit KdpB [Thermoplasmata archaeon]|jgi:K+-transporting ATPase ATPase B chain
MPSPDSKPGTTKSKTRIAPGAAPPVPRGQLYRRALLDSVWKLNPLHLIRNPVMFVVELGSVLTTILFVWALLGHGAEPAIFIGAVSILLWFTVLFGNFAEALAEGRGKAQAEALRRMRQTTPAKRLRDERFAASPIHPGKTDWEVIPGPDLKAGDLFLVEPGDLIPADGEVQQGVASVDESAMTGESAPVIRESGGVRSAVTGGTKVLSDWLVVRATSVAGEGFLDKIIKLIEGAERKPTPNETALNVLLTAFTLLFLVVCVTLFPYSVHAVASQGTGSAVTVTVLVALLVCLAPTTIGALQSSIGIAGMDRLIRKNVIAFSGRAVEAAGDVDVLLLDKTGTITLGNRRAVEFIPADGISAADLAETARLASLADETPEGRSIVVLAKAELGLSSAADRAEEIAASAAFVSFSAQTKMSGADVGGHVIRKGAPEAIYQHVRASGGEIPSDLRAVVERVARTGGTPLVVSRDRTVLGVIHLKDVVKGGIKERFGRIRRMGISTVMVTGDNQLTAAAIAAEAGVDTFQAEATPESKLELIRKYQREGRLVAMTGDGTNDAPALAQADVAVAMNTGTQPAREAANMIDLESNPTKLMDIVETGKQLLMTRGALTTFSISNDVAKYFAIIPPAFASTYPSLHALNIMALGSPILSAVLFNAIIILILIPLALRGVRYVPMDAEQLLRKNLMIYGLGGIVAPFLGIKAIDLLLVALGAAF